jgi:hypothetical protein
MTEERRMKDRNIRVFPALGSMDLATPLVFGTREVEEFVTCAARQTDGTSARHEGLVA